MDEAPEHLCLFNELSVSLKIGASIYAQVADIMPDLLPQSDNDPDQKRGPQKRHHYSVVYIKPAAVSPLGGS